MKTKNQVKLEKLVSTIISDYMDSRLSSAKDQNRIEKFVMQNLNSKSELLGRSKANNSLHKSNLVPFVYQSIQVYLLGVTNENYERIKKILDQECYKRSLDRDIADDTKQYVWLKLLKDDCRRIRNCSGDGISYSYIRTVVSRLITDYLRKKQRRRIFASQAAQTKGKTAVELEMMLSNGLTREQAIELIQTKQKNLGLRVWKEKELFELADQVRPKFRYSFVNYDSLYQPLMHRGLNQLDILVLQESRSQRKQLLEMLSASFQKLNKDEQALLRMKYNEELSMTQISKLSGKSYYKVKQALKGIHAKLKHSIIELANARDDLKHILENDVFVGE